MSSPIVCQIDKNSDYGFVCFEEDSLEIVMNWVCSTLGGEYVVKNGCIQQPEDVGDWWGCGDQEYKNFYTVVVATTVIPDLVILSNVVFFYNSVMIFSGFIEKFLRTVRYNKQKEIANERTN